MACSSLATSLLATLVLHQQKETITLNERIQTTKFKHSELEMHAQNSTSKATADPSPVNHAVLNANQRLLVRSRAYYAVLYRILPAANSIDGGSSPV